MKAASVIDLYTVAQNFSLDFKGSLSSLCCNVIGMQLNKLMQVSDWQQRPLSEDQIAYAALDAFILTLLFDLIASKYNMQTIIFAKNYSV